MCDYSLAHFPNRLAVEGDRLQVYRFTSGTLGLVPNAGISTIYTAPQPSVSRPMPDCSYTIFQSLCSISWGWPRLRK